MTRRQILLSMGLSTLIAAATQVDAQNRNCGPRADIVAHLAENFDESRQAIGLAANNMILEVYAAETGSWTILVTNPGGPACVVAAGENFQLTDEPVANTDPDA